MTFNSSKLINIFLRSATLGARFIFIFFLSKYLDPALLGYYGIFTASVGYALYFVGLDFYTYVSREIIKTPANKRGQLLKGQAALSALLYIALFPVILLLLFQAKWPSHLVWWFMPILFLEHFNQEISRLLNVLSEQLTSSVIQFIRQGSWAIAIGFLMTVNPSARDLDLIIASWAVAGVVAAGIGIWKLNLLNTNGWHLPVDWAWVIKGIKVSILLLLATLALRGVNTFDRYLLEAMSGIEAVGAYVLFLGVASTLMTFLDAAIFAFAYPVLIQLNDERNYYDARQYVKRVLMQTIVIIIAFCCISLILIPHLLLWIGNPLYQQSEWMYSWLIAAISIYAISMVPHFALYARGLDKPIIYSHIISLLTFGIVTWLFSHLNDELSVLIGLNASFFTILIWNSVSYIQMTNNDNT